MRTHYRKIVYALIGFCLVGLGCLAYAYFVEPFRLVVNEQQLKVRGWNRAFSELKIVAVSDIHGGSRGVTEERLRHFVETINGQNADLVVLLGDFVSQTGRNRKNNPDSLKMPVAAIVENLKGMRATYGVFAVLGNHDGWFNDDEIASQLKRAGIQVLQNELAVIEKNGQKLRILGLKDHMKIDTWDGFSREARRVLESGEQAGDVIVLEHSPDILPVITGDLSVSPDLRLILAGHTHGGQVWLPIIGSPIIPSSYGQKYSRGHIRENGVDMFVTTGLGTSILPLRFLVPPEIAVLTIEAE